LKAVQNFLYDLTGFDVFYKTLSTPRITAVF